MIRFASFVGVALVAAVLLVVGVSGAADPLLADRIGRLAVLVIATAVPVVLAVVALAVARRRDLRAPGSRVSR